MKNKEFRACVTAVTQVRWEMPNPLYKSKLKNTFYPGYRIEEFNDVFHVYSEDESGVLEHITTVITLEEAYATIAYEILDQDHFDGEETLTIRYPLGEISMEITWKLKTSMDGVQRVP